VAKPVPLFSILLMAVGIAYLIDGSSEGIIWLSVGVASLPDELLPIGSRIAKYLTAGLLGLLSVSVVPQLWLRIFAAFIMLYAFAELVQNAKEALRKLSSAQQ